MRQIEYILIRSDEVKILIDVVNDMLVEGFVTAGGVSVDFKGCYCQAMVKHQEIT